MNEKNLLLQELHRLSNLYHEALPGIPSEKVASEMESLLMQHLEKYPQDTEAWLMLTMVECTATFEDYDRIEKYTTAILEYDKNNIQALLILAESQYAYRGGISDDIFIRLQDACHTTTDKELLSMIYLAIAWYYQDNDEQKYKQALLKSIDYCNKHIKNYKLLGKLYLKMDREADSKRMVALASENFSKFYQNDHSARDVTDVTRFFDEFYKGY